MRNNTRLGWLRRVALLAAVAAPLPALAQDNPDGQMPAFDTVVKDMQPIKGLFTFYRYEGKDTTKDATRLLAVIPRALLDQDLLLATSISRGPMMGYQWSDYLVRWQLSGRRLLLRVPDTRFIETPGQPVTDAVKATYPPAFLTALPVITMTPQGDPVVDLSAFVFSRAIEVPTAPGTEPRRDLSTLNKVKSFPDNALIDCDIAYATRQGAGITVGVSYAFRRLPDLRSFQPRVSDERVGYFTTTRQDWNSKYTQRENIVRYANRWNLKKKDPSLEMSPPEKPITFIIEKSVPLQWRRYVSDGILEWNKAFEEIGIVGAVAVQQQTDDNEFAEIDPEDARYNFIRWIVTGEPFAMGPSRADPRTGQILDADIIFDDSMLRYNVNDFDVFGPRAVSSQAGPEAVQFYRDHPEFIPQGQTLAEYDSAARRTSSLAHTAAGGIALPLRSEHSQIGCDAATGMRHQLGFHAASMLALETGKQIPERFIGTAIQETVAHEVGHTLGLRHNFKASSWLDIDEIKRRRDNTEDATTASVMDYNALLFFPGDKMESVRHFTTPCVGPYDMWAIEYGYRQSTKEDGSEAAMLAKITSQSAKKELSFATDEDVVGATSVDPDANRWDMASDPVAWAKMRIQLADALLADIRTWAVRNNEPNQEVRSLFSRVMFEKFRNLQYVSRIVGGQSFNRSRMGDADRRPALVVVPAQRQRDAMQLLSETAFNDSFFDFDRSLLNELVPSRWGDFGDGAPARVDFPIHQFILNAQNTAMANLTLPVSLQRIYDAELRAGDDKYTAAEHLQSLTDVMFRELGGKPSTQPIDNAHPKISSIRRNLQMQYVAQLLASAESRPGALMSADLQSMVRYTLRAIAERAATALKGDEKALDLASRAHLSEMKSRIERVLNAPATLIPNTAGATITIGATPAAVDESAR